MNSDGNVLAKVATSDVFWSLAIGVRVTFSTAQYVSRPLTLRQVTVLGYKLNGFGLSKKFLPSLQHSTL